LAIEAAEYLKLNNPAVEITVRDLEGIEPMRDAQVRR
jgi:hypothetical protein